MTTWGCVVLKWMAPSCLSLGPCHYGRTDLSMKPMFYKYVCVYYVCASVYVCMCDVCVLLCVRLCVLLYVCVCTSVCVQCVCMYV